ncbi:hypothetical protein [Georgenia sp. SUBG003]|uniref:hypothetical protein n=1 Tax=Georgenia sp. SUBG003 TaxID=1497974 RepID=UPI0004D6F167|nr:hypothetical protein DA06_21065 [Georgenia sp. SUBG003]
MDLFTILGAIFRRWYVTLPVMLVAGILAYQSYQSVPAVYSSSVSVTVLEPVEPPPPPPDPVTGEVVLPYEANPYSGPNLAAAVLARNLNSASFEDALGLESELNQTIEADPARSDPIIQVIATAESPAAVEAILTEVTASAATILDSFQAEAGATEGARFTLAPAVPADVVEDVTPSRLRTAGAIVVMGLGVAAALATLLDMALDRRNAQRARHPARPGPARSPRPDRPATAGPGPATVVPGRPTAGSTIATARTPIATPGAVTATAGLTAATPATAPPGPGAPRTPAPVAGRPRPELLSTTDRPFGTRSHESSRAR